MADNTTLQSTAPATPAANTGFVTLEGTFSGDANVKLPGGILLEAAGAEGSRTFKAYGRVKSGSVTVPQTAQAVTNFGGSTDYLLDIVWVNNPTSAAISFGVTDGADASLVPTSSGSALFSVPARMHVPIPFYGLEITGLKWVASASGLIARAQGRVAI